MRSIWQRECTRPLSGPLRPANTMEFRILGPLEVAAGEAVLPLAGGQQRALLSILLLHAQQGESAYEPFAQAAIGRLEELRMAALERRFDAELALGRHATLAGELVELAAGQPLRERLRGQLMLALYRSGRQAEALEAYQRAWRT